MKIHPDDVNALHFLGLVFFESGDYDSAISLIKKALRLCPGYADAYNNLGIIYQHTDHLNDAEACYLKALSMNPNLCSAHINLGKIFQKKRNVEEAIQCYEKALKCDPDNAEVHYNLGLLLDETGDVDEAIRCYRQAVQLEPGYFLAYHSLGNALHNKGLLEDAIVCHKKAIELSPEVPEFHYNLAVAFQEKCLLSESADSYRKAIQLNPEFAEAHLNISLIQLLSGNFEDGWKGYEWRWKVKSFKRPDFPKPLWDGADIAGRTILIYAEQGLGDTIQFIRYILLVAQRGAKVIVECQKELASLLRSVEGVTLVIPRGEPLPEFDLQCPLLSLPMLFNTTLETIPANIPYIAADPRLVQKWKAKVSCDDSRLKIGLVWAGKPTYQRVRYRSYTLASFAPLAHLENATFFSLQKGSASEQAKHPPEGLRLIDYTREINDFADTAALVANLDLIIAVETSVAHLAGAMGKPVWALIPFIPDWRWLLNRSDSPWYPTMKLFRQRSYGEKESVIHQILEELASLGALR